MLHQKRKLIFLLLIWGLIHSCGNKEMTSEDYLKEALKFEKEKKYEQKRH